MAQTTEDTGLVPAGVTAARPAPGEALPDEVRPGEEVGPLVDPVQAVTTIVPAATAAMTAARLCLRFICTPGPPLSFRELVSLQATSPDLPYESARPVVSASPAPDAITRLTCCEASGNHGRARFSRHEGHDL